MERPRRPARISRSAEGRILLVGDDARSREKPALLRVKPGDAANSYLYQQITGAPGISGRMMPLAGGPLTAGDMALIQQWINEGAPNN